MVRTPLGTCFCPGALPLPRETSPLGVEVAQGHRPLPSTQSMAPWAAQTPSWSRPRSCRGLYLGLSVLLHGVAFLLVVSSLHCLGLQARTKMQETLETFHFFYSDSHHVRPFLWPESRRLCWCSPAIFEVPPPPFLSVSSVSRFKPSRFGSACSPPENWRIVLWRRNCTQHSFPNNIQTSLRNSSFKFS